MQRTATDFGEEVLERRNDAWSRLLTTFRAVYSGVRHDRLKVPAYKGKLFDPDRFPFLEGRPWKSCWRDTPGQPIPVDNRTVLHLLEALQMLQVKLPGGGPPTLRKLSFRALQITQIGHVYEGLLDHTAVRASEPVLGLSGSRDSEPEVPLSRLEALAAKGEDDLLKFVKDETGRSSAATVKRLLASKPDDQAVSRFRTACQGDESLWERVKPFAGLVRLNTFDYPVVIPPGGVYVTAGTDRRSSGTHYTPESLTEPIVRHTLEPLVYEGPAEGKPREQWKLKSAAELLDLKICDMACGSGAFLVQVCIYLADRLIEAWAAESARAQTGQQADLFARPEGGCPLLVRITPYGLASKGDLFEQLVPIDALERAAFARRIVAERCLYGVDKNPLAVEMAKLSLWLLTLAKDKPFTFLDHAIRPGDSLVGVDAEQLTTFSLDRQGTGVELFGDIIAKKLEATRLLRRQLTKRSDETIGDVEAKERLFAHIQDQTKRLTYAADLLIAEGWRPAKKAAEQQLRMKSALFHVDYNFKDVDVETLEFEAGQRLIQMGCPRPFHWALEFPEVFLDRGGFDAFVGNPPFITGTSISSILGNDYKIWIKTIWPHFEGRADLCVAFMLRAASLLPTKGTVGLVGTDSVSEGDSRISGLAFLLTQGLTIFRAVKRLKWPGTASVKICMLHLHGGQWRGQVVLDGKEVSDIDSALDSGIQLEEPFALRSSQSMSFTGTKVYGNGFVLEPKDGERLLSLEPKYGQVIKPYLVGKELNEVECKPGRYIIDFTGMTDKEAQQFPAAWQIVLERVKEQRQDAPEKNMREKWWIFQRPRQELYRLLKQRGNGWLIAATSDTVAFVAVEYSTHSPVVFSHAVNVLALEGFGQFAVVQSTIHLCWARRYGSSMKGDLRYTTTDCFENFPFPSTSPTLEEFGRTYYLERSRLADSLGVGLTNLYQVFHDRTEQSSGIQALRTAHVEMDQAVADAYGWHDIDLEHGFHETNQGVRYTISEPARREVLTRLLKLNHERHADERNRSGVDDKAKRPAADEQKAKKITRKPASSPVATPLFDGAEVDTAFPGTDRDRRLCGLLCDLVAAQPGLPSNAYLDALVIALRPVRSKHFLIDKDRIEFTALAHKLWAAKDRTSNPIQWADLLDVLTLLDALLKSGNNSLERGDRFDVVRREYPACDPHLIQLIHKAAATLRELQDPGEANSPGGEEMLSEFDEDRRALCGALP